MMSVTSNQEQHQDFDWTTSPDVSITKKEVPDVELMGHLKTHEWVSSHDKKVIRAMLKNNTATGLLVTYKNGLTARLTDQPGRWFACKYGLALLERQTRNSLASSRYWDLDIVGAQPNILCQMAEARGWTCPLLKEFLSKREEFLATVSKDRDEAKDKTVGLFYGQRRYDLPPFFIGLQKELDQLMANVSASYHHLEKHAKKGERSIIAIVLQNEERKCLMAIDRALAEVGRSLDVFLHDGGFVKKLDGEKCLDVSVIAHCQKRIEEWTGYKLMLKVKTMINVFAIPKQEGPIRVPLGVNIDDVFAAHKFLELHPKQVVMDGEQLYVFNDKTGIWSSKELDVHRAIMACGNDLKFVQHNPMTDLDKLYNYSGVVKNVKDVYQALKGVTPPQPGYFVKRVDSAVGKLLFQNGIYDFETGIFREEFDPDIVFYSAVPRPYNEDRRNDKGVREAMDFIQKNLLEQPFKNPEVGNFLLYRLARGVAGHFRDKCLLFCVGPTNSGKGTLCELMTHALGPNSGSFNADSLLARKGDHEATKALSWIYHIVNKRIVWSNEATVDPKRPANGNLLKLFCGGGDGITVRKNFKDEEIVINQSLICLFVNELPPIDPVDQALCNRALSFRFDYSFVENPAPEEWKCEKKAIGDIKNKMTTPEFSDAFIFMVIDTLAKNKEGMTIPEDCIKYKNELLPNNNVEEVLSKVFDITRDEDDKVEARSVLDYLRFEGCTGSDNALGRELSKLGIGRKKFKIGGMPVAFRTGVKAKDVGEDEEIK